MYTTADWQTYFESDLHPATLPKPTRKDIRIALADYINRGGDTEYTKFWSLIERLLETP
jgi:hypothetical protein